MESKEEILKRNTHLIGKCQILYSKTQECILKAMQEYADLQLKEKDETIECDCGHTVPIEYSKQDIEGCNTCYKCIIEEKDDRIKELEEDYTTLKSVADEMAAYYVKINSNGASLTKYEQITKNK